MLHIPRPNSRNMDVEPQYRPAYEAQTISDLYKILPDQTQLSPTEKRNPNSMNLASSTVNEICQLQLDDTLQAIQCLGLYLNEIEKLIQDVVVCLKNGGRLYYVGAGSSGRIALLDSLECPPTFGSHKIDTIVAGGSTFGEEQGFAEDDLLDGYEMIEKIINKNDFVLGITAGGHTRFVWSALYAAIKHGAHTGLLTFNEFIKPKLALDHLILVSSGPEILTGSTRLKCGTLTKVILNMISTAAMIKLGYCVSNLMVNVKPTNLKLKRRLVHILMCLLESKQEEISEDKAVELLEKHNYDVKKVLAVLNLDEY